MRLYSFLFALTGIAAYFYWQYSQVEPTLHSKVEARTPAINPEPNTEVSTASAKVAEAALEPKRASDTLTIAGIPALAGTEIPNALHIDHEGNLIVNDNVRHFFDYFLQLLGTGEYNIEELTKLIEHHMEEQLQGEALSQAYILFDRYSAYYQDREQRLVSQDLIQQKSQFTGQYSEDSLNLIQQYYERIYELKNNYFSSQERQALFQGEEQYEHYMLQRLAIGANTLNSDEAQLQLAQIDGQLSEQFRQQRQETHALQHIDKILQQANTHYEKHQQLSESLGEEKADRLLQLEQEHQQWKIKKQQYFTLKQKIAKEYEFYSEEQVNQLMDAYMPSDLGFSEAEMKRMKILEGRL